MKKPVINFGEQLKKLRMGNGLTQQQLAERLGVTKSVISYYENGSRNASAPIIVDIARLFHVTTDSLLGVTSNETIDISMLTMEQIAVIHQLINIFLMEHVCKDR